MANKVILMGSVSAPIVVNKTKNGASVATMKLLVTREVKDDVQSDTVAVTLFGRTAENCEKFLHLGSEVFVEGHLSTYQSRGIEVIAESVQFLEEKKNKGVA